MRSHSAMDMLGAWAITDAAYDIAVEPTDYLTVSAAIGPGPKPTTSAGAFPPGIDGADRRRERASYR